MVNPYTPTMDDTGITFDNTGYTMDDAGTQPYTGWTCGEIDAYDHENGSILLAWRPFLGFIPTSYNIYVNDVLALTIAAPAAQCVIATQSSGTPLQITTYSPGTVAPATGNSIRPQNMPPKGFVTLSGTYRFKVVGVINTTEVAASPPKKVTVNPTSIMLVTPMPRLWPFPNTGLD